MGSVTRAERRLPSARRSWAAATAALALLVAGLVATLALVTVGGEGGGTGSAPAAGGLTADRFDADRAWALLERQVQAGPRPAGSRAARALARRLAAELPGGRLEPTGSNLVNVVGRLPGSGPAVLVGAHYDTRDEPGLLGANDGASGVAVVVELARVMAGAERPAGAPELRFVLFDGEESPDDSQPFDVSGLRGSRAYAARHARDLEAVIVLDMVGDAELSIPREAGSDPEIWERLRAAARAVGAGAAFPDDERGEILDDHTPFARAGVPAADVIDFDFDCWHEPCDDLSAVSARSLDVVGETMAELLLRWR